MTARLETLRVEGFRCLVPSDLVFGHRTTILGPNGAGKTSLLESIYFLARGRSFRTRNNRKLVQTGAEQLLVRAELVHRGGTRLAGIQLARGGLERRLAGAPATSPELASALPIVVIDPNIHALIEGGPDSRRGFLDWGVFHVEPQYLSHFKRYRRALTQRNAALKAQEPDLGAWTAALLESGAAVTEARERYVEGISAALATLGDALLDQPVRVLYRPGWAQDREFAEALAEAEPRDRDRGITHVGPHRGELVVMLGDEPLRDHASRGQQKLAAAVLALAQVDILNANAQTREPLLLVDDPMAELGPAFLERFLEQLNRTRAQLLVTGLTDAVKLPGEDGPLFHVEQGNFRRVV